ncbi:DUF3558 domain-containing protein [Nocardia halotolerans]|uniref:DUF3558 domain-containing protein n=1 Tax=Nocardia halotolerans TaxID=1755878 RepID=A0ABV8VM48_9NOCA
MRLVGFAAGMCAVLALAGCSDAVDGQPEASGAPPAKEQLFDPCTVPDSVLIAAGADPASKDDNPFSVPRADWKGCGWRAGEFFIDLFSTTNTMDEFRDNRLLHDFQDVAIEDRKGVQYLIGETSPPEECGLAFESSRGTITLQSSRASSSKSTTDPCVVVNNAAPHFIATFPK